MEIPKKYDFKESEEKWIKYWEQEKIYKFDENSEKPIYSIDTPPPTVSGKMHIGHSSMYSQMDFIARYKRMRGFNLFYPFGTDDNGLATEHLVERTNNVKSAEMNREEFIQLCLNTLNELGPKFIQDWKNLGVSCDFEIFYSTIDTHSRIISQRSFIDLYKEDREYRMLAPVIWCPLCQTAIAQVDLKDKEKDSSFNDIKFKVDNEDVIISTTRPELLPACVAVFYHPEDERYKKFKDKKAKVPLFDYEVPILEDSRVEKEKGTGIVMCCTFGDQTDIEWYKAFNLPLKKAITKDGRMTSITKNYEGLTIKEARIKIIEDLKKNNLLVSQKEIKHTVNVHERCNAEIEIIESYQWFLKYLDIKDQLLIYGNELKWFPEFMKHRYDNWVKGLQWDWCISRQRHFGIPIPVWYCKKCSEIKLAEEHELPVDPLKDKPSTQCKCGSIEFEPEKDVLDTWPTSSLTPQLATELFKDKQIYTRLFPMNLRPQAHDIITFWLFNTVVKSRLHYGKNPWSDVSISGFVLDPHGKKMSKSLGNTIEPQTVMDKYGADALRFWAASVKLGDDIPYQEKEIVSGQKTVVKLWNASKLCLQHLQDYNKEEIKFEDLEEVDRWLLNRLNYIVKISSDNFQKYEYSRTKAETENFFWNIFCDYYLEIVKDRLYNPDKRGEESRRSAQCTLYQTLLTILKLFAPIMPFVTEEIYSLYFKEKENKKSIHVEEWPSFSKVNTNLEVMGDLFMNIVSKVRKFKTENKKTLKESIELTLTKEEINILYNSLEDLKAVTNAKSIKEGEFKISF
jgi:valyl-tRNA synthetase